MISLEGGVNKNTKINNNKNINILDNLILDLNIISYSIGNF